MIGSVTARPCATPGLGASLLVLLLACSHTYQMSHPVSLPRPHLRGDATAYIAAPENGRYQDIVYEKSGAQTLAELQRLFRPRLRQVEVASSVETYEQALESSRARSHDYLIFPEIKHWEDRATEWSGRSDQLEIRLTIFDVASGTLLDAIDIRGRSRWGTLGGDHPQELIAQPLGQYVTQLFGER